MEDTAHAGIVVVGGGLAGLAAAIEALQQTQGTKADVVMVEKEPRTGGNSAKASSGINGAWTETQKTQGIEDSVDAFEHDTFKSGRGLSNGTLVKRLTQESAQSVAWLQSHFSLDLDVISQLGGHSAPRTHRRPDTADGHPQPVGWGIVSALAARLSEQPRFRLISEAQVVELVQEPRSADIIARVAGVVYKTADGKKHKLHASAVVLATGGFAGDGGAADGFIRKHAPQLAWLPATNGGFATGDGIKLGMAVGAGIVGMEHVQVHPTGFVSQADPSARTKFLAAEALRGGGALLLNGRGERFVNELDTRDNVTAAINAACSSNETRSAYPDTDDMVGAAGAAAFLVLSQAAADAFGHGALGFYEKMHLIHRVGGLSQLAAALRVPLATLRKTLSAHDDARSSGSADAFGKQVFPQPALNADDQNGLYFWAVVTPSIHYTMGGLRFDENARVLHADSSLPIPGLFAAGEVTGGLHGANRLAGNSLLECVVFGREAGKQAALTALQTIGDVKL
ncbi:Osmotic growth protein 1 [Coemansia asiatica]|nr:Osmotic growth protein 1 [Coemansia asiatica]